MAPKPKLTDKQAARRRSEASAKAAKVTGRKRWEASPEGQGRLVNATQFSEQHAKMSVGQIYEASGWTEGKQAETHHPRIYDRQLPGMEDPLSAEHPPRWEDIPEAKQAEIQHRVKLKTGVDLDFMERSFGSQLDQSYRRADFNTHEREREVRPAGQDFYSHGEPRQVMKRSAEELGIPFGVHAAMNAITSPQTKFKENYEAEGRTRYPNNEAAEHVVRHIQSGGRPWNIHATASYEDEETGVAKRHSGYPANFVKAGLALEQHLEGKPLREWRNLPSKSSPEGSKMFGPKTGPYHNSWLPSTPDFLVSDIHTGGGGFLPHQGTSKPLIIDKETGEPRVNSTGSGFLTGKSEQESSMETSGFHSMADYAARQALTKRGLGSVRQAQATQWNEQRLRRSETDKNLRNPLTTEAREYSGHNKRWDRSKQAPGQLGIQFD